MGLCASILFTDNGRRLSIGNGSSPRTAKVIHSIDGRLQEFRQPIKAGRVISDHPNTFLCSSETMFVNHHVPHVPGDEELQPGQIYFLMPLAKSNKTLSLQELCSLAVKASSALEKRPERKRKGGTASFRGRKSDRKTTSNGAVDFQLALKQLHDGTHLRVTQGS